MSRKKITKILLIIFAIFVLLIYFKFLPFTDNNRLIKKSQLKTPVYSYGIKVLYSTLDEGLLKIKIRNIGNVPLNLSYFYLETPDGDKIKINKSIILHPNETRYVNISYTFYCYNYSEAILLQSPYYHLSEAFVVYCR